jgi:hypothetical protein
MFNAMVYLMAKRWHILLELLYSKKYNRGEYVVENVFDILKKTFMELFTENDLNVFFVPNVFTMGCLLHNLLWS